MPTCTFEVTEEDLRNEADLKAAWDRAETRLKKRGLTFKDCKGSYTIYDGKNPYGQRYSVRLMLKIRNPAFN